MIVSKIICVSVWLRYTWVEFIVFSYRIRIFFLYWVLIYSFLYAVCDEYNPFIQNEWYGICFFHLLDFVTYFYLLVLTIILTKQPNALSQMVSTQDGSDIRWDLNIVAYINFCCCKCSAKAISWFIIMKKPFLFYDK